MDERGGGVAWLRLEERKKEAEMMGLGTNDLVGNQTRPLFHLLHSCCPPSIAAYLSTSLSLSLSFHLSDCVTLSFCLPLTYSTNHLSPRDGRRLWFSVLMLRQS